MRYTTFGRTGLTVSTLGLGGASIGGAYGPVVDEPEALRTIQAAVDLGITFIDTIPGTKSVARLEENVAAWRAGPLPPDVLAEILRSDSEDPRLSP